MLIICFQEYPSDVVYRCAEPGNGCHQFYSLRKGEDAFRKSILMTIATTKRILMMMIKVKSYSDM